MSLSLQQMDEALKLSGWSEAELARRARVSLDDLAAWRSGGAEPATRTLEAAKSAFEAVGIAFGSAGVERGGEGDGRSIPVDRMNSANDE